MQLLLLHKYLVLFQPKKKLHEFKNAVTALVSLLLNSIQLTPIRSVITVGEFSSCFGFSNFSPRDHLSYSVVFYIEITEIPLIKEPQRGKH